jgi:hypothetical protein
VARLDVERVDVCRLPEDVHGVTSVRVRAAVDAGDDMSTRETSMSV